MGKGLFVEIWIISYIDLFVSNNIHAIETGLRKKTRAGRPVIQYTRDGQEIAQYLTAKDASKETGVHYGNICMTCRGERNHAGGYIWKYK